MTATQTVCLMWPHRDTWPNCGKHRRDKSKAAAGYKEAVAWEARQQGLSEMDGPLECAIVFHKADRRRYDLDNALAAIKSGLDAIAEIVGVDDSEWNPIELQRGEPKPGGCVYVTLRGVE